MLLGTCFPRTWEIAPAVLGMEPPPSTRRRRLGASCGRFHWCRRQVDRRRGHRDVPSSPDHWGLPRLARGLRREEDRRRWPRIIRTPDHEGWLRLPWLRRGEVDGGSRTRVRRSPDRQGRLRRDVDRRRGSWVLRSPDDDRGARRLVRPLRGNVDRRGRPRVRRSPNHEWGLRLRGEVDRRGRPRVGGPPDPKRGLLWLDGYCIDYSRDMNFTHCYDSTLVYARRSRGR